MKDLTNVKQGKNTPIQDRSGKCAQKYVRLNSVLSSVICTNTSASQGTFIAPFLFLLYTADSRSVNESCPLLKFVDNTELVGKISNDEDAP